MEMSDMDEVTRLLDEVKAWMRRINRMFADGFTEIGKRWIDFHQEEFAHWSERVPALAEPLDRRLGYERDWHNRRAELRLTMNYSDIVVLLEWRQLMNEALVNLLLQHDEVNTYDIAAAKEWRQESLEHNHRQLHALFWFADAHRQRMLDFSLLCDARDDEAALRAINSILVELKIFAEDDLPNLLQLNQPHAISS